MQSTIRESQRRQVVVGISRVRAHNDLAEQCHVVEQVVTVQALTASRSSNNSRLSQDAPTLYPRS